MKYCVDILAKATGSFEDDNLKGERRWERQAARALLDAGRLVGSIRDAWARPDTPLWTGIIENLSDHVLLTQADPGNVRYCKGADAFVSNVFCGLTSEAEAEIRRAVAEMGRSRIALTHSFQVHCALKRLPEDLHDLIHWLPVPAVPRVRRDIDTFLNKTFLWSARAINFRLNNILPHIVRLLDWIRDCLDTDSSLRFEVLAGEEGMGQTEADRWVWGFPPFEAAFLDVREQVKIHPSIAWSEVMKIYERTKLVVNDPTAFGGPPIEAASFGIPMTGVPCSSFHTTTPRKAKWPNAPEYNGIPVPAFSGFVETGSANSLSLVDLLDRWHKDEGEYHRVGDAYRTFVEETYTYASFVRHLDALPIFG